MKRRQQINKKRKNRSKYRVRKKKVQRGKGIGDVADGTVNVASNLWKDLFGWI